MDAGYKSISKVEPTATTNCNADPACNNQLPGRKTLLTRQIAKNILIPSASNILNVDSVGCNSTGQYVNCFPYKFGTDECYDANDGESGCFDLTTYGGDEISIEGKYYNGKCVICNKDKGTLYLGAPITTYNYGSSLVAEMCLETCGADEGCDENLWDGDVCDDGCEPICVAPYKIFDGRCLYHKRCYFNDKQADFYFVDKGLKDYNCDANGYFIKYQSTPAPPGYYFTKCDALALDICDILKLPSISYTKLDGNVVTCNPSDFRCTLSNLNTNSPIKISDETTEKVIIKII